MRRLLLTLLLVAAVGGAVVLATGAAKEDDKADYIVELDNAFGLITGGDVKVAGVRAGKVTSMEIDTDTKRALIGIDITQPGFESLRKDVHCESRPQSLIGEYFIDCQPGTDREELPGKRVPVEQTGSTVPPDLVNDIMRLPYRERLRVIVAELGTGLAGRGEDLNEAIRRASPALRETDRVLKILGDQNETLKDLVRNADVAVGELADNRKDVSRFVVEARDTAQASAERRDDLARTFNRLPGFLEELRPTMAALGRVADEQTPALRDLGATSGQLERLFENLGPFARASGPAFESLGRASRTGRRAVRSAGPIVSQLRRFSGDTPELAKNLAITLEDLDDRDRAIWKDPRSPNGQGFTGLEALLDYVITQALSINIYDSAAHTLKVSLFEAQPCGGYAGAREAREPDRYKQCAAGLGPNQPGITTPDPTVPPGGDPRNARNRRVMNRDLREARQKGGPPVRTGTPSDPDSPTPGDRSADQAPPGTDRLQLGDVLQGIFGEGESREQPTLPDAPVPSASGRDARSGLVDFLFAP